MDSMRSLNTSLPSTRPAPPEQLLQAFRTAALSVTNLYKSAAADQNSSRQAGYQEALEDLLSFLDRENLGLQDGEGWRVRQWATERYDGSALQQQPESDDEKSETENRPRSTSPAREQPTEPVTAEPESPRVESPRVESVPEPEESQSSRSQENNEPSPIFHFIGNSSQPSSDDMQTDDGATATDNQAASSSGPVCSDPPSTRGNRTLHKHSNQRHGAKSSSREFTFTAAAGTKRKLQFSDFFDISNIAPRDGFESSKRGRTS